MEPSYPEVVKIAQNKVARYDMATCYYAIKDCHDTLKLWPNETPYTRQLWAEIDACRDRMLKFKRGLQ